MIKYSEERTVLQYRHQADDGNWTKWTAYMAGMYQPAIAIAEGGDVAAALALATKIRIENYGSTRGVEFRCLMHMTTVTMRQEPISDGWNKL